MNPLNFISEVSGSAEDIMQTFFWLDEDNPGAINLFQLVRNPGKCNASDDTAVHYNDSDDWPAHPPVGLWFKYGVVDDFMREWLVRKNELKAGEITREEYLEWKLNWPETCDECGKFETKIYFWISFKGFFSKRLWYNFYSKFTFLCFRLSY